MADNMDKSFGWDDEVETADGGGSFQLLDEGPAEFVVTDFARGRFMGSARMSPCHQAELTLRATDPAGHCSDLRCKLPLNTKMAWKLTAFFKSVGLIDADTPSGSHVRYQWDRLVGTRGICEIEHYDWTGDDGQVRTGNSAKSFLFGRRAEEARRLFGSQRTYGGRF